MDEKVAKTPRPHMLDADEVAELLRIKKGSAYEVIRKINAEQEAMGAWLSAGAFGATSSMPCTSRRRTDMPVYKDDNNGTYYVQCYYRDARGSKRSKTMAFRCTPEERKLICEMAAWSGMSRQDYIIAKLTDIQVEVRPSVSVQKALKDSMAELAKEVSLAASYGELSNSLQQRIELVIRFFLALGEPIGAPAEEEPQTKAPSAVPKTPEAGANGDMSIFGMGRG